MILCRRPIRAKSRNLIERPVPEILLVQGQRTSRGESPKVSRRGARRIGKTSSVFRTTDTKHYDKEAPMGPVRGPRTQLTRREHDRALHLGQRRSRLCRTSRGQPALPRLEDLALRRGDPRSLLREVAGAHRAGHRSRSARPPLRHVRDGGRGRGRSPKIARSTGSTSSPTSPARPTASHAAHSSGAVVPRAPHSSMGGSST